MLTFYIVEDSPKAVNGIIELMQPYTVWNFAGATDSLGIALEQIFTTKPCLLFLDWDVVGGSTFEILEKINATPEYNPYIIYFTGFQYDYPEIPMHIINNRYVVDRYIIKPIFSLLEKELANYLNEAKEKFERKNTDFAFAEIMIEDNNKNHIKIDVTKISCIQKFDKDLKIIHFASSNPIVVKLTWALINKMLQNFYINYFAINEDEAIVIKKYIVEYRRPIVSVQNVYDKKDAESLKVTKNKLAAFSEWLQNDNSFR